LKDLSDPDKTTRILSFDTVALVSNRIQQRGEKTDGSQIQNGYSSKYSKKRQSKGRQTDFVDLTFTGDMMADFLPVQIGSDWGVGFVGKKSGDIAEYNERRFGVIFSVSDNERNLLSKSYEDIVKNIIK
jgi:hypothetical protein